MKYNIRSKNIEITAAMNKHINDTFNKLLRYTEVTDRDAMHIDIEYTKENVVEVHCAMDIKGKNNFLMAKVIHPDFYKAIEQALQKMEEQIRKIKGKREDKHSKSQSFSEVISNEREAIIDKLDENDEAFVEFNENEIIKLNND